MESQIPGVWFESRSRHHKCNSGRVSREVGILLPCRNEPRRGLMSPLTRPWGPRDAGFSRDVKKYQYVEYVRKGNAAYSENVVPITRDNLHYVGESGDGAFAYFDTARDFGCILKAIAKPGRMWEPERMVPEPGHT